VHNKFFALIKKIPRKLRIIILVIFSLWLFLFLISFFVIPNGGPYSYALYDKNGILLGAQVAKDEQWRFERAEVPYKFKKAIVEFEDKRFYWHLGVDPISIARAAVLDIKSHKIVSGGSTITMQTIRILEKNPKRTIFQKIKEAFLAGVLETRYSKNDILELYAANAPFGGNVVGLEAASWRYFHRPPTELSWAETATLAVLPNQPSLVYPGANSEILLEKRNRLLKRLYEKKVITEKEYNLSLEENIPEKPYSLPALAPHYLELLKASNRKATKFYTSLDRDVQLNTQRIAEQWSLSFSKKGIENAAVLILDTKTGNVIAYCANTGLNSRNADTWAVDLIQSRRSSGSLLKPFLFCAMVDSGQLLPEQLVIDIPTRIGSYKPGNNIPKYAGVVPAGEALTRSLNIPAIRELRDYGINAFLDYLKKYGFTTLNRTSDEYGLPLILGGGEITLCEAAHAYAKMMNIADGKKESVQPSFQGSAWITLQTLSEGSRPDDEANWQIYANSKRIAWKTGTSSGNRDAWAIGTTCEYTVAVWVGNATGEGRPDLKSVSTSAPLMFDVFSSLPVTTFPVFPLDSLDLVTICSKSGYLAGPNCVNTKVTVKPKESSVGQPCPYCQEVSLTPDRLYQATAEDLTGEQAGIYDGKMPLIEKRFVLPPNLEYWFKKSNLGYISLPSFVPWHKSSDGDDFSIIFPESGANLIIPVEIDGSAGSFVMQAAARSPSTILYWDIDGEYIGLTENIHELSANLDVGEHIITVVSSDGVTKKRKFYILDDAN